MARNSFETSSPLIVQKGPQGSFSSPRKRLVVVAECGILMAMALALSQIRLFQLPSGGSVSIGSLPLLLLSARHGVRRGVISGIMTGVLSALLHPSFIVHPAQFLLDYPLAFGSLGLAGFFRWSKPGRAAGAVVLAGLLRLHCHVFAGVWFFSSSLSAKQSIWIASYSYNLIHMLPETILCATLAFLVTQRQPHIVQYQADSQ